MKLKVPNYVKVVFSLVLLSILINKADTTQLQTVYKTSNLLLLMIAFVAFLGAFFLQTLRLQKILSSVKIEIHTKEILKLNLVSLFFGLFLPTNIGGDIFRISLLNQYSNLKNRTIAVIRDRVIGFISLIIIAFVSTIIGFNIIGTIISHFVFVIFVSSLLTFLLLNNRPLLKFLTRRSRFVKRGVKYIAQTFVVKRNEKIHLQIAFIYSIGFYLLSIVSVYFIALGFSLSPPMLLFFLFVPLMTLASTVPITFSGLGVREIVSVSFFTNTGISTEHAILLAFVPFLFKTVLACSGGIWYTFSFKK